MKVGKRGSWEGRGRTVGEGTSHRGTVITPHYCLHSFLVTQQMAKQEQEQKQEQKQGPGLSSKNSYDCNCRHA